MREWENRRAGAERRWEEETGKERESDRKRGNSKGGLELRQRAQNSSSRDNPLGGAKESRGLLGPKTLGSGPHVDNGLVGPREWQKVPMGRIGLNLLIPIHYPLVTECHFPSLPYGCQGKSHTSKEPQTQPTPHKAS